MQFSAGNPNKAKLPWRAKDLGITWRFYQTCSRPDATNTENALLRDRSTVRGMKLVAATLAIVVSLVTQLLLPVQSWTATLHTPFDIIPDFAGNSTINSVANGSWSSASTWSPARVPGPSDIVKIRHSVTYESTTGDADIIGIDAGGALRFSTSQSTRLRVGTLLVMPDGTLEIGTPSAPIPASLTAEIIIKNKGLNSSSDPDQYGTGLVSVDGRVVMRGATKTPTFIRTAVEPRAGNTTISLNSLHPGGVSEIGFFVPDTRQVDVDNWFNSNYALQVEVRTIQSISGDAEALTLSSALSFDHRGAKRCGWHPNAVKQRY